MDILAWLIACITLNLARYLTSSVPFSGASRPETLALLKRCLLGSLLSGVLWSAIPVYFIDYAGDQAAFVSIVLCGLTAGAAIQGNSFAAAVIAMVVPVLGVMTCKVFFLGTQTGYILSADLFIYLAVIVRSSITGEQTFVNSVLLKTEAHDLAERLRLEHAASQAAAERYFHLANHDPLTGIENRSSFTKTIQAWLDGARTTRVGFSLFLIDLDHFKSINDTLGHSAGDAVLCEVARRLTLAADTDGRVARLGGDEFALLVAGDIDELAEKADLILRTINGPLVLDGGIVALSASVGIATFREDGADVQELMARADLALYAAKETGRRCWRRFDRSMLAATILAHDVERDLPEAIAGGSLDVWWQPQVNLTAGILGLEGLLRWCHPVHGWIAPPDIVASALKTRTSEALTGFVLAKACSMIAELDKAGRQDMVVAVNISPAEIVHYDLPALVGRSIEAAGVDASRLELEITEETLLSDDEAVVALSDVARSGVRLAIDDFGAGCASLAYLRRLPIHRIKIDRCFVTGLADREGDRILVQALLGLGTALGIEVVAEGVETIDDVLMLRHLGCQVGQGYHFSKAVPAAQLRALLDSDAFRCAEPAPSRHRKGPLRSQFVARAL